MVSPAVGRLVLNVFGLILIALVIWFGGPYLAVAGYEPLGSVLARSVAILIVVLAWATMWFLRRWRARRYSARLAAAVVQPTIEASGASAEATQLRERFEEAIATLRKTRTGAQSLYDLPWYVIIGAPGSGKTTALTHSGLHFPLESRHGRGAIRGVGGTRNCDWWFTDEAVFLDTAGRYTTQDSDGAADSAGWNEFLTLLRTYRTRRPVNGVILTISVQDLLGADGRARERHIEAARRRLAELNQQLQIQLPVYVMVTKCDLIAGFAEYFDDFSQEQRRQVWGVTFAYDDTLAGRAPTQLDGEFDALVVRLNERVLGRVQDERDVPRRVKIFGFPQQVAALRDSLVQFVTEVFSSSRFEQQVLLRGVYLTSGTQEGTPIDRLLGAIGRKFGVAEDAVAPAPGRGKAYFVERLLKEVLIGESGLAGVNRRFEMRKAAMQLGLYAALALVALAAVLLLTISYRRNRAYIAGVDAEIVRLAQTARAGRAAAPEMLLPRLDALGRVVSTATQHEGSANLLMRWGLFQGRALGNAARDAYVRELDTDLLPRVAMRIQDRLVSYASEPEKLFEYLKAYAMLGDPARLDKRHLQFVADLEWRSSTTSDPQSAARLSQHFTALLDLGDRLRPLPVDRARIAQAQNTLRQASIAQIIYNRLKRSYADDRARAVRLDLAAGVAADQVLRRKSGASLADPVPALFTRSVFQEVTGPQLSDLVRQFAADDWVWGEAGRAAASPGRLASDVSDLYERDYIAAWDAVLGDLELVPLGRGEQADKTLGLLSGPASPLRGIFATVVEHTNLVAPPKTDAPPDLADKAAEAARKAATDRLGGLFTVPGATGAASPTAGALVTAHFQPVHRLMEGAPGQTPLDAVLARLGQVQAELRSLPQGSADQPPDVSTLKDVLQDLQQVALTLPAAVKPLVDDVVQKAPGAVAEVPTIDFEEKYVQEVLRECTALVAGRYPFTPTSPTDVQLPDFARVFGYGGLFDTFYRTYLERFVDRSDAQWRWRSGPQQGTRALLDKFQAAEALRELFFNRANGELGVRFAVTVTEIDPGSTRGVLEVDGVSFEFRQPPARGLARWPSLPNPGMTSITLVDPRGFRARRTIPGPWAWFRLVDESLDVRVSDVRFELLPRVENHHARVVVEPVTVLNPFASRGWQRFSCEL